MKIKITAFILTMFLKVIAFCQDTSDIFKMLENELKNEDKNRTEYVTATFKTTRLVTGHTVENTAKGVMDLKVSHRFGEINSGAYQFFGLDNARMRLGFDFGITNNFMIGVGRSTLDKTFDAFFKLKILRQSTGKHKMPITLSYVPTIALKTLEQPDSSQNKYFVSRLYFTHQLIIGRKFSEGLSLQIMPTYIHRNSVTKVSDPNDIFAIGIGGRQKLSKRTSFNVEYYYQLPGYKLPGSVNSFSVGFDIETGGHVFQLHFTNSRGMTESALISETRGLWHKGDILFGFNISRVFTISKKH